VWVSAHDRAGLERLARYVLRPPFAQERLRRRSDGRVVLELKTAWHDGARELVFEPLEFDQHGAGAADAVLAARVRAGQPQTDAQELREEQPGHDGLDAVPAIDAHANRDGRGRGVVHAGSSVARDDRRLARR
jgi:hypothetical protein